MSSAVETANEIRPFNVDVTDEAWRISVDASRRPGGLTGNGCLPRRTARDDPGTGQLLGDGLRLAQVRGAIQGLTVGQSVR
jgi:hypothetical protein